MPKKTPTTIRALILATRPATLPAVLGPVGLGISFGLRDGFRLPVVSIACLLVGLFLQVSANLANDYFDALSGADCERRLGPPRALSSGWLTKNQLQLAIAVALSGALCCGVVIVARAGPFFVLLGVLSALVALAYSAGPLPLAYHGLGEVAVALFFGPVAVVGSYWVLAQRFSTAVWIASAAMASLSSAILVVNNIRDRETDLAAGKRTLAVLLGNRFARIEYAVLVFLPFVIPLTVLISDEIGHQWWIVEIAFPLVPLLVRGVFVSDGRLLNAWLKRTVQLSFLYASTLSFGVLHWN